MEEQGQRIYFVFGPELNHQVLSGQHFVSFAILCHYTEKSGTRRSEGFKFRVASMNGDQHKRNRRLVMDAS